jgi:hypothetical protein
MNLDDDNDDCDSKIATNVTFDLCFFSSSIGNLGSKVLLPPSHTKPSTFDTSMSRMYLKSPASNEFKNSKTSL